VANQSEQYNQYETQYAEEEVEYYEEDTDGWLWDEATGTWVEDPNWVDPNQDQYYEQDAPTQSSTVSKSNTNTNTATMTNNTVNSRATAHHSQSAATNLPSGTHRNTTAASSSSASHSNTGSAQFRSAPADIRAQQNKRAEQNQNSTAKIDEKNIPRVKLANALKRYDSKPNPDILPPSSREQYVATDCGNATPRHVRLTLYNLPVDMETATKSQLAMGAIFQPFANVGIGEMDIPLVDMGGEGPIRCRNCRAYMNPHVLWFAEGSKWSCNLCHIINECPQKYRANLDGKYQRRDRMQRHELHRGSVDYVAPKEMIESWCPKMPAFFFVIDVSTMAFRRDLVTLTVQSIHKTLVELRQRIRDQEESKFADHGDGNQPQRPPAADCVVRVGFLTYSENIHFHALSNGALHVISEVKDPFVALPDTEILIKLMDDDQFAEWERLLLRVPKLFEDNALVPESENKSCFGAALMTGAKVLAECGGKLVAQQTALPNIGIGKLLKRGSVAAEGTNKEQELYVPADTFYTDLMLHCSQCFISVDAFVCATEFCDVGSVGAVSRETGGQIYYYSNFHAVKDGKTFAEDLRIDLMRPHVFRAIMAVRCSRGLETAGYQGNFFMNDNEEFVFPVVTTDTAFSCILQHYSSLDDGINDGDGIPRSLKKQRGTVACIQMAMLFMTMEGEVRIRVHTVSTPVVRKIADVFRCVDVDAVLNLSLKQVALDLLRPMSENSGTVRSARTQLLNACVDILWAYRKYCASNNAHRQLVLPEALKLLPLYTLGLLKNALLRDAVPSDERGFYIAYTMHMTCEHSLAFVHPYLHPMHKLSNIECVESESGQILRPQITVLKYEEMKQEGLYVMDTGTRVYVIYGVQLPEDLFNSCFVVNESRKHGAEVELRPWGLEENDLGYRLTLLLEELRTDRPFWLKTEVLTLPNTKDHDQTLSMDQHTFLAHLIEDASRKNYRQKSPEVMSYVDFLVYIHRKIQHKFNEDMY